MTTNVNRNDPNPGDLAFKRNTLLGRNNATMENEHLVDDDVTEVSFHSEKVVPFMRHRGFCQNFMETFVTGILNMFTTIDFNLPILIISIYASVYSPMEMLTGYAYVSTFYKITILSFIFGLNDSIGVYTA